MFISDLGSSLSNIKFNLVRKSIVLEKFTNWIDVSSTHILPIYRVNLDFCFLFSSAKQKHKINLKKKREKKITNF